MGQGAAEIELLQERLGHRFSSIELLMEALTHRSFVNESTDPHVRDNQRLEFFGDAVIGYLVSALLFQQFPASREGELTRLRASLVHEERLASLASALGIGSSLRLGRGEERAGGRERRSLLADAFEALVAAVCLDGGEAAARRVVERQFLPLLDVQGGEDFKTRLQEEVQGRGGSLPVYCVRETCGPSHAPRFVVEVVLEGCVAGRGEGKSKKEAEQAAARAALGL